MRYVIVIFLLTAFLLPGCERADPPQPDVPWIDVPVIWDVTPVEGAEYTALTVTESARYTVPENIEWPPASGAMGRTVIWTNSDINNQPTHTATVEFIDHSKDGTITDIRWDLNSGTASIHELDLQLSDDYWPSIHRIGESGTGNYPSFYNFFFNVGGESESRQFSVDDDDFSGWPIVSDVQRVQNPMFGQFETLTYTIDDYELSATEFFMSEEYDGTTKMLFRDLTDYELKMPDGTIRFVPHWVELELSTMISPRLVPLDSMIEQTFGADPTYYDYPRIFLSGKSPFDSNEYIFINFGQQTFGLDLTIAPADEDTPHWSVNGIIPLCRYQEEYYFFAQDENYSSSTNVKLAAFCLRTSADEELLAEIIWNETVPDIFGHTMQFSIHDDGDFDPENDGYFDPKLRYFIVCLNQHNGEFTIFDPILGSIRHQSTIDIEPPDRDDPLPSFCDDFSKLNHPINYPPTSIFIHDPNANEIIQLEITVEESEGPSIRPLE